MHELTPDLIEQAFARARDEALEAAARMVEARAVLYRGHGADLELRAKAEEAADIAAALRALKAAR